MEIFQYNMKKIKKSKKVFKILKSFIFEYFNILKIGNGI